MTNLQKCHSVTQRDGKHCQANDNVVDNQVTPLASPSPPTAWHQLRIHNLSPDRCARVAPPVRLF